MLVRESKSSSGVELGLDDGIGVNSVLSSSGELGFRVRVLGVEGDFSSNSQIEVDSLVVVGSQNVGVLVGEDLSENTDIEFVNSVGGGGVELSEDRVVGRSNEVVNRGSELESLRSNDGGGLDVRSVGLSVIDGGGDGGNVVLVFNSDSSEQVVSSGFSGQSGLKPGGEVVIDGNFSLEVLVGLELSRDGGVPFLESVFGGESSEDGTVRSLNEGSLESNVLAGLSSPVNLVLSSIRREVLGEKIAASLVQILVKVGSEDKRHLDYLLEWN